MSNSANSPRLLVVALSGIGNLIMQIPMINAIKTAWPKSHLTVWVAPRGTRTIAESTPSIDEVIEIPIKTSLGGHIKNIQRLRALKADIGIVASPGQQIKSAAYLFLAGIPTRAGHMYPLGSNPASRLFLTNVISEKEKTHDIEQNLALLSALQLPIPSIAHYSLTIPSEAVTKAQELINSLHLDPTKPIIGFHAGSAPDFIWKRWPLENFAAIGKQLIAKYGAHILLFGGKGEAEQNETIKNLILKGQEHLLSSSMATAINAPDPLSVSVTSIQSDLFTTAAVMQKCRLIVSNDSGLMHLAAASGVETFGLFGPTDEKKTGPRGPKSYVIRAEGTKPAYNTEKNYNLGRQPHPAILALIPELVLVKLDKTLRAGPR